MQDKQQEFQSIDDLFSAIADVLTHIKTLGGQISLSPEALAELQKTGGGPFIPVAETPQRKTVTAETQKTEPLLTVSTPKEKPAIEKLEDVREWIGDCTGCVLAEKRNNLVFGEGNPHAELMFIGEGPGADEDRQGRPFIGRAGQLLTKMIEAGMGKKREEVYIANMVKCRPPGNRDPLPDEMGACRDYLDEQIRLISPKVICTLGRVAAQALLNTKTPISRLRGNWYEYKGIKVMPTFHPAALLRNPANKRPTWEDLQMIMKELGWQR